MFPAPVVHPDLATTAALAAAHKQRAEARVEITLVEVERLLYPEPARQRTTISPRMGSPATPSPATRMTATFSSTGGGSAG
jgi:hypothetical protein